MYTVNDDLSVYCTRGDFCHIPASGAINGVAYTFRPGDVVRFKAFRKKDCGTVVIQRDLTVTEETEMVLISLTGEDTKIGEVISKPVDYWYEIELNPDTNPQTIRGYDEDGPKVFRLFPEGKDVEDGDIEVVGKKTLQELVDYALEQANESGEFDGKDGITPHIRENGNWWVGDEDTGTPATGEKGDKGDKGDPGAAGEDGNDGVTPHIGNNGNWWFGNTDTGVPASSGVNADMEFFTNALSVDFYTLVNEFESGKIVTLTVVNPVSNVSVYYCTFYDAGYESETHLEFIGWEFGELTTINVYEDGRVTKNHVAIGDIESALDGIIEIQNSLIGGDGA